MAKQSKTLELMFAKLGLEEDKKVLCKAAEFERLLQLKSTTNNITDTAKVVLCLDIATSMFQADFDQKLAIKCSGLKGPTYLNNRKMIENVLELNNYRLSISALCLMLQCEVQELADRILQEYRKGAKMELDMDLPQYVCMAVFQACRISKIKVPKNKLIDKSQLKPAQWAKLDAEWSKFTDEKFATVAVVKKSRKRPAKNAVKEEQKTEVDTQVINNQVEDKEPQEEPYEDWKRRILQAAYKELEQENQNTNKLEGTPKKQRNSPHKNMNKQTDSSNKQKSTPNKLKDTPIKQKKSPNKQKELKIVFNTQNDMPNKQGDSLIKQKASPNKEEEYVKDELEGPFSPRRLSRKSPHKFEPYKRPIKNNDVKQLL